MRMRSLNSIQNPGSGEGEATGEEKPELKQSSSRQGSFGIGLSPPSPSRDDEHDRKRQTRRFRQQTARYSPEPRSCRFRDRENAIDSGRRETSRPPLRRHAGLIHDGEGNQEGCTYDDRESPPKDQGEHPKVGFFTGFLPCIGIRQKSVPHTKKQSCDLPTTPACDCGQSLLCIGLSEPLMAMNAGTTIRHT